jgi:adenylate cyclase
MTPTRRLAAILAADVAGYSRLMGADEVGTLEALKAMRREIGDPTIAAHKGRIVKTTGDGTLVEFASAVDAVTCAVTFQEKIAERNNAEQGLKLSFRIGINVGDVIVDGDDIYGDGVNIAARIENECEPGGVYLSDDAFRQVRGKTSIEFEDVGERALKNIERPVRIYAVRIGVQPAQRSADAAQTEVRKSPPLPDKPSIAVLPFQNMSGDPEQDYFADGIVEDIITALSRFKSLFVVARNSSFTYKGRAVDVRQVGQELGVRYVLEGSVRKTANRLRITGQLLEAPSGAHVWADRFDGTLEDIFDLQDGVTTSVVGAIFPQMISAEIERTGQKRTDSFDAYDWFMRGTAAMWRGSAEDIDEALKLFYRAIELDPAFATPYANAALCYLYRRGKARILDPERETVETTRLARRAVELGKDDAWVLCLAGCALAYVAGELDEGTALIDRALALNPNLAWAWTLSGWLRIWLGVPELAIDHLARSIRLSPLDVAIHEVHTAQAHAYFFQGKYDDASACAAKALSEKQSYVSAWHMAAVSNAMAGRVEEARAACLRVQQYDLTLRISNLGKVLGPYRRAEDRARYAEALRKAGLPE